MRNNSNQRPTLRQYLRRVSSVKRTKSARELPISQTSSNYSLGASQAELILKRFSEIEIKACQYLQEGQQRRIFQQILLTFHNQLKQFIGKVLSVLSQQKQNKIFPKLTHEDIPTQSPIPLKRFQSDNTPNFDYFSSQKFEIKNSCRVLSPAIESPVNKIKDSVASTAFPKSSGSFSIKQSGESITIREKKNGKHKEQSHLKRMVIRKDTFDVFAPEKIQNVLMHAKLRAPPSLT